MKANQQRIVFWSVMFFGLCVGLIIAFWPRPKLVDLVTVERSSLQVTITDEGNTRIHDIYTLSSPINGRLRRIDYDVGDKVVAGQSMIVEIEPVDAAFLDPRSEALAEADLQAAQSARELARETVKQAEAELEFASAELKRIQELRLQGTTSQRELDSAQRNFKTTKAALATAHAALQVRNFELQRVEALLRPPSQSRVNSELCDCMTILAPISGTVLKVITKSEGVVLAGAPLIEIGNPKDLEIVVELLSVDAVKVVEGMPVIIDNWGGDQPLQGRVKRVEPFGFTKFSALGIEEQRVNVLIELLSPHEQWQRLGHGYQLDASIVLWQQDNVLTLPVTSLYRKREKWMLLAVVDGEIEEREIQIGRQNSHFAQVISGVDEGEFIIKFPSDQLYPGLQVMAKE